MRVKLDYHFSLHFEEMVKEHRFALRITPRTTQFYTIKEFNTEDRLFHTQDGFGNTISFGEMKAPHDHFEIYSHAKIHFTDLYREIPDRYHVSLFLFETPLTQMSLMFLEMMQSISIATYAPVEKVRFLTGWIYENFTYEKNCTHVNSGIEILLGQKKGVCQDFAHLMITMLRYYGIPARYVLGFVPGEGESHAWVEYFDGAYWYGVDPTHNVLIGYEPYIKIAHGRDAADVFVNQGIFVGNATQQMDIKAIIKVDQ
ncbi:MAG: hypothetical protein RLZZ428_758 [Pseudomonadota bacterium]